MIVFKKITYSNFLSTGDKPVEIELNTSPTTLIVGANGEGKSILLDALSFGLFGKPHRDINKPQLVNSVNGKDTLVEIEFSIGTTKYCVRRGIKPNIFEIFKNGVMINQQSHSRDYQKVLENSILKLNHRSFHQIVVLGSSSFIPFMQLAPYHRRGVIEDLLDISIFSKMNSVLRDEKAATKETLATLDRECDVIESKIELQKEHINDITSITDNNRDRIETEINVIDQEIVDLGIKIEDISYTLGELETLNVKETRKQRDLIRQYEASTSGKIKRLSASAEFFKEHDVCPSCSQTITMKTKQKMIDSLTHKISNVSDGYAALKAKVVEIEKNYQTAIDIQTERNKLHGDISYLQRLIQTKEAEKLAKLDSINETHSENRLIHAKEHLTSLLVELNEKRDIRTKHLEGIRYQSMCDELLKDTGIKTKIIKQYLPAMNRMINEYLQLFDFFVSFTIDENFNEKIRSRHRDDFSYASFSEGEKARIDLALMFTWRRIAKLKHSTDVNLLILDEIMDASLDEPGLNALKTVFDTLEADSNIVVISHRGEVKESSDFSRLIKVYKKDLFTHAAIET